VSKIKPGHNEEVARIANAASEARRAAVVTPVEERIDHEERVKAIKMLVGKIVDATPQDEMIDLWEREIRRHLDDLLPATEPAQPGTAVANDQSKLMPIVRTPSVDHAWDADERFGNQAQEEPAQPDEEPND
jgi:hypothetical protein